MIYNYSEQGIRELEEFFELNELPVSPFRLNPWTNVIDCGKFVENTLCLLNAHIGVSGYQPYYDHILELANYIENQKP